MLVAAHVLRFDVGDQALLEVRANVLQVVAFDALRGSGKGEALEREPFIGSDREQFGAVSALYAVVTLFQLAAPGALGILGDGFGAGLGALADALTLKNEVVPPDLRVFSWSVNRHFYFPPFTLCVAFLST